MKHLIIKKGNKFVNRATRRRVTVKDIYDDTYRQYGDKAVVQFWHGKDRREHGALYREDFKKFYRPLVIALSFLFLSFIGLSQSVKMDSTGNYIAVQVQKDSATATGKTFTDSKGIKWPVFISKNGKLFVQRISKNTGKEYRQYLKLN
jgi:hypothetical protein